MSLKQHEVEIGRIIAKMASGDIYLADAAVLIQKELDEHALLAFKDGMTKSAAIAHPVLEHYRNQVEPWLGLHDANLATSIEKQILSARDNTTALP